MQKNKGLTLIELILVIFIVSIMAVLIISGLSRYKNTQIHKIDVDQTISALNSARIKASTGENSRNYSVTIDQANKTLTISLVQVDPGDPTYSETINLNSITTITSALSGQPTNTVVFTRYTGETLNTGTITVSTNSGGQNRSTVVRILPTGLANIE
jgi:prepilin-type N-terminal cleavage/methylation domain-containing protein